MSAWTPKFVEISKFSSDLEQQLQQCFVESDRKLQTRTLVSQWDQEVIENVLEKDRDAKVR